MAADDKAKAIALTAIAAATIAAAVGIGVTLSGPSRTPQDLEADRLLSIDNADPLVEVDRLNSVGDHVRVKVRFSTLPKETDRTTSVRP